MEPNSTVVPPQPPTGNKKTAVLLIVFFCILLALYVFTNRKAEREVEPEVNSPESTAPNAAYLSLKENPVFTEALEKIRAGQIDEGIALLNTIQVQDSTEHSYIEYVIAEARHAKSREEGMNSYLDLLKDTTITNQTKAFAANALAQQHSLTHDEALLKQIQSDAASWIGPQTHIDALRQATTSSDMFVALLEISSFYMSTMDTEMRLAYAYARRADAHKKAGNEEGFTRYFDLAQQKLSLADSDPNGTQESENLSWTLPAIIMRKAMTVDMLMRTGEYDGDPAVLFKQAIALKVAQGESYLPFYFYNYAVYLAHAYGSERKDEITKLLEPVVQKKGTEENIVFEEFMKNAFKNNETGNMEDINGLIQIYEPFGTLLE